MGALVEPFFYCLILSMIWAPVVMFCAARLSPQDAGATGRQSVDGVVWPAALMFAALPALVAPIAGAFGFSLRRSADLPPMAAHTGESGASIMAAGPATLAADSISFVEILWTAAVLYFYAFLMLLALAAIRHVWFSYRLHYAAPVDEPALLTALEHWRKRIGVTQRPRYVFSHIVSSVCVYGFFRPVVVLPYNMLDRVSIADAALMGAHEMAHVKRGDVFLFALCSVAKAVFWFNPFMHHICARAALAAEQGADALVLARGVDRRQYAQCFVQGLRLAAGARQGFPGALVPSFTPFDKRSRRARLDAILSGRAPESTLSLKTKLSLGAGAALAAALAVAQAAIVVEPPAPQAALPVAPVAGEITLGYGKSLKPVDGKDAPHAGVDIKAARGAPVKAAGAGKVIDATDHYRGAKARGNVVVIDHGHGLVTRYAHLDSYAVRKGDRVAAGDVIGAVGSTGNSSGPHLHFEVISGGETIDPSPVVAPAAVADMRAAARVTRSVNIAPAAAATPSARPEPGKSTLKEKLATLEERLKQRFEGYEPLHDFDDGAISLNELDFEDAEALAALMDDHQVRLKDLAAFEVDLPDMQRIVENARLSDKDLATLRKEQERAMRAAERAMREVRRGLREDQRARKEALKEMRAQQEKEAFKMRRDDAVVFADVRNYAELDAHEGPSETDLLDMQEREIRKAKADLERQLADIEERRKKINVDND